MFSTGDYVLFHGLSGTHGLEGAYGQVGESSQGQQLVTLLADEDIQMLHDYACYPTRHTFFCPAHHRIPRPMACEMGVTKHNELG